MLSNKTFCLLFPALATVKKGERVWWAFNDDENFALFLKEVHTL